MNVKCMNVMNVHLKHRLCIITPYWIQTIFTLLIVDQLDVMSRPVSLAHHLNALEVFSFHPFFPSAGERVTFS